MRPEGGTKRQQAAVTNASAEGDDGTGRKRKKIEPTVKEEVADEERTLKDFDTVYDYLENTKPKHEFEDFATLKELYIPLLVQPGDDYTRQAGAEQDALPGKGRRRTARLPKDGGIFFDDIPLHHRTTHALHPLEEQRLKLCGLAIKKGKRWTPEEDEVLVENWREYAARHNIPLRDAPKFFGTTKEDSLEFRERRQRAQTTLFHPWMCKLLLHRTCKQTKRRGLVLFHPKHRLRAGKEMWSADDDEQLLKLVKAHNWNFKEIALQMGRIRYHCIAHYYWLQKHGAGEDGTMLQAKKRRTGRGVQWSDEDAQRLQHLLDRFGSQWHVVGWWMDRSADSCKKYAFLNELKFERRRRHQMTGVERYPIEPWSADQLQKLLDFLREVLPCNPMKFLRSEEYVGFEHGIDWYAASERTSKSPTECRMKWSEFKEHILDQVSNGRRKKDILPGLLQLTGALKQRVKVPWHKWTAAEVQQLVDMVGELGRCWVRIGRELNREPKACMDRYGAYKRDNADHALQRCHVKVKEELAERDEAEVLEGTEPPPAEDVFEEAENKENDASAPPLADVTPSQLSHCISIVLEQDVLKSKRDFDADWLQINLHKMPSLACWAGDLVRHVRRMLRRSKRAGMWARLPLEQRTLRDFVDLRFPSSSE